MAATKSTDEFIAELWGYANEVPMGEHPWFKGIVEHHWTAEQIVLGETQHYLRVRTNIIHWAYIMVKAAKKNRYDLLGVVMENFLEEVGGERSHADIMFQFLEEAGLSREQADHAEATPGTAAAIESINGICLHRSALEGMAAISFVESQHGGGEGVAAKVYRELTGHYGFSPRATETYNLHAAQDVGHGGRQIDAIRKHATDAETQDRIRRAVKLGVTAYT
ncbi:MAG TPA: iron-containing redox enzyme family protein, partial [Dehalococcoidia bacterium]|nr:iron-containing redox enzyme family protein [Dehalococcoidia bacterium]